MKKILGLAFALSLFSQAQALPIWDGMSAQDREDVSLFLWYNESGATRDGLTEWADGEDFISVGYGHMIWFPRGEDPGFVDSFPLFLKLYNDENFTPHPPQWIQNLGPNPFCPWQSRSAFQAQFNSTKTREFRDWLYNTRSQQSYFYVRRLEQSLEEIFQKLRSWNIANGETLVNSLLQNDAGALVLVDYVNFKGEGLSPEEVRNGIPWGLSRAIYWMNQSQAPALEAFAYGASQALKERVTNARLDALDEARWLEGWLNRTQRYKNPEAIVAPLRGHGFR